MHPTTMTPVWLRRYRQFLRGLQKGRFSPGRIFRFAFRKCLQPVQFLLELSI